MARQPATRWTRRALALTAVATAALGFSASTANAATTTSSTSSTTSTIACATRTTAQKFLAVDGDNNAYFTSPAGTFESGATGWSLTSASVVSGNESRYINGSGQTKSLQIGSGGKAVGPQFCNQYGERSIRFFYKGASGARVHLHIDVSNSSTSNKSTLDWEIGVPSSGWGAANGIMVPDLYSQGYENLQLTFTALGGSVQVDDVEIDPWKTL
jgi:hypothetical protein